MDDQLDLLDAIDGDPTPHHEDARRVITRAIRQVALENGGAIDPNEVRRLLTNEHGRTVYHKLIGPRYSSMRRQGLIERCGTNLSDDTLGRNAGRPQWTYRWVGGASC